MRDVATLILPADAAWGSLTPEPLAPVAVPPSPSPDQATIRLAADALRSGKRAVIVLSGRAMRQETTAIAGKIAALTGAALFSTATGRSERGAGRVPVKPVPYNVDLAIEALKPFEIAVCVGGGQPVAFFAYPGKPSTLLPASCEVIHLARHEHDLAGAIECLADEVGVGPGTPVHTGALSQTGIPVPSNGSLDADNLSLAIARYLPDHAILIDEALTSAGQYPILAAGLPPHDHLPIVGGAIGIGIPLAVGAAIARPDRKVVALQSDGSGLYTVQGLWTQAREQLDIVTIVFANHAYKILQREMTNVGVQSYADNARRMLNLDNPRLDWCSLAKGLGVEAGRAATIDEFRTLYQAALRQRGPFLIEAVLP